MHKGEVTNKTQETEMQEAVDTSNSDSRLDSMEANEAKDMDLGDLDLDALEA